MEPKGKSIKEGLGCSSYQCTSNRQHDLTRVYSPALNIALGPEVLLNCLDKGLKRCCGGDREDLERRR